MLSMIVIMNERLLMTRRVHTYSTVPSKVLSVSRWIQEADRHGRTIWEAYQTKMRTHRSIRFLSAILRGCLHISQNCAFFQALLTTRKVCFTSMAFSNSDPILSTKFINKLNNFNKLSHSLESQRVFTRR